MEVKYKFEQNYIYSTSAGRRVPIQIAWTTYLFDSIDRVSTPRMMPIFYYESDEKTRLYYLPYTEYQNKLAPDGKPWITETDEGSGSHY